jgi:CBS domain-containing protein
MLLKDILAIKGKHVLTIQVGAPLCDVAKELAKHNIGSLVVCDGESMVGIITERDILRAVAELGSRLDVVPVKQRMTTQLITASPDDDVEDLMGIMTEKHIRHLPVLAQGQLAGMVSIGDLVKAHQAQVAMENQQLRNYIQS